MCVIQICVANWYHLWLTLNLGVGKTLHKPKVNFVPLEPNYSVTGSFVVVTYNIAIFVSFLPALNFVALSNNVILKVNSQPFLWPTLKLLEKQATPKPPQELYWLTAGRKECMGACVREGGDLWCGEEVTFQWCGGSVGGTLTHSL